MPLLSTIKAAAAGLLTPIAKIVDDTHTSAEEKILAIAEYLKQSAALTKSASDVIVAEASSDSWLAASWRPIMMLSFLGLVYADSFGVLPSPLAPEAWTLLQIGLGGYVGGRTIEKSVKAIRG